MSLSPLAAALGTPPPPDGRVMTRFEWAGMPEGWGAAVAVALAATALIVVVALYRRERAARMPALRWVCCALRVLCLGSVAALFLQPSAARDVERETHGLVLVLADRSASMSLRDAAMANEEADSWRRALGLADTAVALGLRRHDLALALLRPQGGLLKELRRRGRLEVMAFAGAPETVLEAARAGPDSQGDALGLPEWEPTGGRTDVAGAVSVALESPGPVAGLVLISDGRDTEGGDLRSAASAAARQDVPVHVIPVGSSSMPRNVAVTELLCAQSVLSGMPLEMRASVRSDGYAGKTVRVVLTARSADAQGSTAVTARAVTLRGDGTAQEVDLSHVPPASGVLTYTAAVEAIEGEARLEDNAATRTVTVSDQRVRVLLVAGALSRECRFLKTLLDREPTYDVTACIHGAAPAATSPLPDSQSALLSYSTVLLCDPSPEDLSEEWLGVLADLVDREGLGLVFAAGSTNAPELLASAGGGRLRDLLPVTVDASRARLPVGSAGFFTEGWPLEMGEAGSSHPITRTAGSAAPDRFWAARPRWFWALPVGEPKPGASVLLRWGSPDLRDRWGRGVVLVAAQQYGLGRVLFVGSPETWRWRRNGIEHYQRFWLQALRYCAQGGLAGSRRGQIDLDRSAYDLGEPVRIRATIRDSKLRPLEDEQVTLSVQLAGALLTDVDLRTAEAAGQYRGVFYPDRFGRYTLLYTAADGDQAREDFEVRPPDREFRDPRADLASLQQLAEATGGRLFQPDQVHELAEAVPDMTRVTIEPGPLRPLWDRSWLLVALIVALGGEWLLRKRMGLL